MLCSDPEQVSANSCPCLHGMEFCTENVWQFLHSGYGVAPFRVDSKFSVFSEEHVNHKFSIKSGIELAVNARIE